MINGAPRLANTQASRSNQGKQLSQKAAFPDLCSFSTKSGKSWRKVPLAMCFSIKWPYLWRKHFLQAPPILYKLDLKVCTELVEWSAGVFAGHGALKYDDDFPLIGLAIVAKILVELRK